MADLGSKAEAHGAPDLSAATRPGQFTWAEWKQILKRSWKAVGSDNLSLVAAGVAFYAMLALFPGIAALVTLYGFVSDPSVIQEHLTTMDDVLPPSAYEIIERQVSKIASSGRTTLGVATLISLAVALWSSRAGVGAMISGLNIVYDEEDKRGFFKSLLVALVLTAVMLFVGLLAVAVVILAPILLNLLPLGPVGTWITAVLRWPVIVVAVILGIGALYRWAPSRTGARVGWLSWGAAFATVVWLAASMGFSFYVANFGSYNETYGSLSAVVVLLMWFYISAFIVLFGAELNAQMEHQTRHDTTAGPVKPMGDRGAHVADTLPKR
ncbi:MAG: YihY/virulence factor BrkB family protein [Kiloniellales bacterium]